jgi:RHS repeat-associated protein
MDSYSYDENGNMTCRIENNVTYKQNYNAENRISSIAIMNGDCSSVDVLESWSYGYDGNGTRIREDYFVDTFPTSTKFYLFGGMVEVNGNSIKKYYAIAGQMIAMKDDEGLKYFLSDHLGSFSAVLDENGAVVSQQRYLPFGGVRNDLQTPPYRITQTDFGYTGQRNMASVGLMDYKARFYDPYLNRFIQPDSIIPNAASPQTWNRYSYVMNRPTGLTDPSGHRPCDDFDEYGHCITYDDGRYVGNPLDSAVVIIFGTPGENPRNTLGIAKGASAGTGVVVGNKSTVVTAGHVYGNRPDDADTVFIMVNGVWVEYSLADVSIEPGPGDLVTLTLPNPLPGNIVPAEVADNYHSAPGQSVDVVYAEPTLNEGGQLTGYTLHVTTTSLANPATAISDAYGKQLEMFNPNQVLNSGDSGGGVFYHNQLIGLNSGIDATVVAVAPLCYEWYWNPLRWYAIVC